MPIKLHSHQSLGAKLYFPQHTEVKVHFWNYFNIFEAVSDKNDSDFKDLPLNKTHTCKWQMVLDT